MRGDAVSAPIRIVLGPMGDPFDACRELVEAGAEDVPVEVYRGDKLSITCGSLYRMALTAVAEVPSTRFIGWMPHFRAATGPRMQALIEQRKAARAEKSGTCS